MQRRLDENWNKVRQRGEADIASMNVVVFIPVPLFGIAGSEDRTRLVSGESRRARLEVRGRPHERSNNH